MSVRFGVDILLDDPAGPRGRFAAWERVGLVTNDAARPAESPQRHSRLALRDAGVPIHRLFGPEHGLAVEAPDGAAVCDGIDALTGIPVVSLYGERMCPTAQQLGDLDAVLFDVPDVGARCYTYAWTLFRLLHACAEVAVPVVVLDRPNPVGGCLHAAEGPLLEESCRSFIGDDDIPLRHSLTLGELARLWQREHVPAVPLEVLPCGGWQRRHAWPALAREWIPTSPAMPGFESAVWYAGSCLFEATNLSVARGTTRPFAQIGAPWLAPERVIEQVAAEAADAGAVLTVCEFIPTEGPHAHIRCSGVHIRDAAPAIDERAMWIAERIRPVRLGLALLSTIARLHPDEFSWAHYPTAANPSGANHFARLLGRANVQQSIAEQSYADRTALTAVAEWRARCAPVLLY